jgi:cold shock CspA family protein
MVFLYGEVLSILSTLTGSDEMVPVLPEIEQLEKITSAQTPSDEGAWWITLQIVDHIINSITKRDPINNAFLPELMSDFFNRFVDLVDDDAVRPLPNDIVQQLIDYCYKATEYIIKDPRTKMVKETTMVSSHKLKSPTTKTINWLAKQPGRNIKEKLAGKNKILSQVNHYSYNTKENQVFIQVLKELRDLIEDRIENGINEEGYDFSEASVRKSDKLEAFKDLHKKIRNSPLADIVGASTNQPNNILINDKNYSVIWRSYQELIHRKHRIAETWNYAFARFVASCYFGIASYLTSIKEIALIDQAAVLYDENGIFSIPAIEKDGEPSLSELHFVLVDDLSKYIVGTIAFVHKEKRFGFIQAGKTKYHFTKSSLFDESVFDSLHHGQEVYFLSQETKKGLTAYHVTVGEYISSIKLRLDQTKIDITISNRLFSNKLTSYRETTEQTLTYDFSTVSDLSLERTRGIQFKVEKFLNRKHDTKWTLMGFGDMKGLKDIVLTIGSAIVSVTELTAQRDVPAIQHHKSLHSNAGMDFSTTLPLVASNRKLRTLPEEYYSIIFQLQEEIQLFHPKRKNFYNLENKVIPLKSILENDSEKHAYTNIAFGDMLHKIHESFPLAEDEYFIYTVPDSIDEFSQKNIKKEFNLNFKKAYPVWRSIAAAMSWKNKVELVHGQAILVIDTHEESSNAVLLKVIKSKKYGRYFFEHYAPYPLEDEGSEITFEGFKEDYLSAFLKKYNITMSETKKQSLLDSGTIEKVLVGKKDELVVVSDEEELFIKIYYDRDLYRQLYQLWLKKLSSFLTILKNEAFQRTKVDHMLIIGDHVTINKEIDSSLRRNFNLNTYQIISSSQVISGAIEINKNLKLKLPTWYEYLPNLSLEVIKDGHYDQLRLIYNESIENVMGEEKEFIVNETLTLEKGHANYKFPLIKGSSGKNNIEVNAFIKHESFPLKENIKVKLSIKYQYGYENSYLLMVTPAEGEKDVFTSIIAEWVEETTNPKNTSNIFPKFPEKEISTVELLNDINIMNEVLGRMYRIIDKKLHRNTAIVGDLEYMEGQFFKNIYRIRRIVSSRNPAVMQFVKEFRESELLKYIVKINSSIPEYLQTGKNKDTIDRLKSSILQFLCSFGVYVLPSIYHFVTNQYHDNDAIKRAKVYGALLCFNTEKSEIIEKIFVEYNRNQDSIIRSISIPLWKDEKLIKELYRKSPAFIASIITQITSDFKKQYRQPNKRYSVTAFRDYCEVLLSILRLREDENFQSFKTGSKESIKLAKYIRKIDASFYKESLTIKSRIKFDAAKPDSLSNMSDLTYALNIYLTGEDGVNLIQVTEIEDMED